MACGLYAAAILAAWSVAKWSPADWWPVHLVLYGPRWVLALPMLILVPAVAWRRSGWSVLALEVAAVGFLALWGLVVPIPAVIRDVWSGGPRLRVLTCNVQFADLKVDVLAGLIREARPDLVLLQECQLDDPGAVFGREGWHVRSEGEFFLASRLPIVRFSTLRRPDRPTRIVAVQADLSWEGRTIPVVSAHLMTPRFGLEAIIRSPIGGAEAFRRVAGVQRAESALLRRWVANAPGSLLLAGDLNLTPEHPLYRRDWSDYANAYSDSGLGLGRTMSTRRIGLRIDHVLCGPGWWPEVCWVGSDVGSAHLPVLADLSWVGTSAGRP